MQKLKGDSLLNTKSLKLKAVSGFTLIELLIVVAIIGLLASVIIIGLQGAQRGGRDARRISDLRQIQNGLQLYYNSKSKYPDSPSSNNVSGLDLSSVGVTLATKGPSGDDYKYAQLNGGTGYLLATTLDDPASKKGGVVVGSSTISGVDCASTNVYCIQF